jgi:hypothetical protein
VQVEILEVYSGTVHAGMYSKGWGRLSCGMAC